jgi:sugar lactone lactonase YvrE
MVWMLGLAVFPLPLAVGGGGPTVVASGLLSPRGLALGANGSFFVAEAGKGGARPCGVGPLGEMCVGRTGHLTQVSAGELDRLVRLSSIALADGSTAFGPHDVALSEDGPLIATIGLGGHLETREQFGPRGSLLGTLVRVTRTGRVTVIADIAAFEEENDPNGDGADSDPYGILREGTRNIVTDAGGNSLLRVSDRGRIRTIAVFPDRNVDFEGEPVPMDSVPTAVVRGPDGALYVSELTGFPFPVGEARVYRVEPGQDPEVWATGFTNIIDIAFDATGNLYVVEIAHNSLASDAPTGAVLRVSPDGSTTTVVLDQGLSFPTSVVIAENGNLLVTNCGVCPGGGEVLEIVP